MEIQLSILGRKTKSPFEALDKVSELGLGNFIVDVRNIIIAAEIAWTALPDADKENLMEAAKAIGPKLGKIGGKALIIGDDIEGVLKEVKAFISQSPRLVRILKELTE